MLFRRRDAEFSVPTCFHTTFLYTVRCIKSALK